MLLAPAPYNLLAVTISIPTMVSICSLGRAEVVERLASTIEFFPVGNRFRLTKAGSVGHLYEVFLYNEQDSETHWFAMLRHSGIW